MAHTTQARLQDIMNAYLSALRGSGGVDTQEFFSLRHKPGVDGKSLFYL